MNLSIKEFNTYQKYAKQVGYKKILCSFCSSEIIPIEKNETIESVKCIYCNTIMKLSNQTIKDVKTCIIDIIKNQRN